MAITHWIITNTEGELVGQYSQLMVGSRKSFDDCEPPTGYKKTELPYNDFEKINSSFNRGRRIYQKFINPTTSRAKELPESKKEIHEARAKPKWVRIYEGGYIETKDENGKIVATVLTPEF